MENAKKKEKEYMEQNNQIEKISDSLKASTLKDENDTSQYHFFENTLNLSNEEQFDDSQLSQSEILFTSYCPVSPKVLLSKNFSNMTLNKKTPQSVYSTPRDILLEHNLSLNKAKINKGNKSMSLIDLTTPGRLTKNSKSNLLLKSAIKRSAKDALKYNVNEKYLSPNLKRNETTPLSKGNKIDKCKKNLNEKLQSSASKGQVKEQKNLKAKTNTSKISVSEINLPENTTLDSASVINLDSVETCDNDSIVEISSDKSQISKTPISKGIQLFKKAIITGAHKVTRLNTTKSNDESLSKINKSNTSNISLPLTPKVKSTPKMKLTPNRQISRNFQINQSNKSILSKSLNSTQTSIKNLNIVNPIGTISTSTPLTMKKTYNTLLTPFQNYNDHANSPRNIKTHSCIHNSSNKKPQQLVETPVKKMQSTIAKKINKSELWNKAKDNIFVRNSSEEILNRTFTLDFESEECNTNKENENRKNNEKLQRILYKETRNNVKNQEVNAADSKNIHSKSVDTKDNKIKQPIEKNSEEIKKLILKTIETTNTPGIRDMRTLTPLPKYTKRFQMNIENNFDKYGNKNRSATEITSHFMPSTPSTNKYNIKKNKSEIFANLSSINCENKCTENNPAHKTVSGKMDSTISRSFEKSSNNKHGCQNKLNNSKLSIADDINEELINSKIFKTHDVFTVSKIIEEDCNEKHVSAEESFDKLVGRPSVTRKYSSNIRFLKQSTEKDRINSWLKDVDNYFHLNKNNSEKQLNSSKHENTTTCNLDHDISGINELNESLFSEDLVYSEDELSGFSNFSTSKQFNKLSKSYTKMKSADNSIDKKVIEKNRKTSELINKFDVKNLKPIKEKSVELKEKQNISNKIWASSDNVNNSINLKFTKENENLKSNMKLKNSRSECMNTNASFYFPNKSTGSNTFCTAPNKENTIAHLEKNLSIKSIREGPLYKSQEKKIQNTSKRILYTHKDIEPKQERINKEKENERIEVEKAFTNVEEYLKAGKGKSVDTPKINSTREKSRKTYSNVNEISFDTESEKEKIFKNFEENPKTETTRAKSLSASKVNNTEEKSRKTQYSDVKEISFDIETKKERMEKKKIFENFEENPKTKTTRGKSLSASKVNNTQQKSRKTLYSDVKEISFDIETEKERIDKEKIFKNFEENPKTKTTRGKSLSASRVNNTQEKSRKTLYSDVKEISFDIETEKERMEKEKIFENFEENPKTKTTRGKSLSASKVNNTQEKSRKSLYSDVKEISFNIETEKERMEKEKMFENFEKNPKIITKRGKSLSAFKVDKTEKKPRRTLHNDIEDISFDIEAEKDRLKKEKAFENCKGHSNDETAREVNISRNKKQLEIEELKNKPNEKKTQDNSATSRISLKTRGNKTNLNKLKSGNLINVERTGLSTGVEYLNEEQSHTQSDLMTEKTPTALIELKEKSEIVENEIKPLEKTTRKGRTKIKNIPELSQNEILDKSQMNTSTSEDTETTMKRKLPNRKVKNANINLEIHQIIKENKNENKEFNSLMERDAKEYDDNNMVNLNEEDNLNSTFRNKRSRNQSKRIDISSENILTEVNKENIGRVTRQRNKRKFLDNVDNNTLENKNLQNHSGKKTKDEKNTSLSSQNESDELSRKSQDLKNLSINDKDTLKGVNIEEIKSKRSLQSSDIKKVDCTLQHTNIELTPINSHSKILTDKNEILTPSSNVIEFKTPASHMVPRTRRNLRSNSTTTPLLNDVQTQILNNESIDSATNNAPFAQRRLLSNSTSTPLFSDSQKDESIESATNVIPHAQKRRLRSNSTSTPLINDTKRDESSESATNSVPSAQKRHLQSSQPLINELHEANESVEVKSKKSVSNTRSGKRTKNNEKLTDDTKGTKETRATRIKNKNESTDINEENNEKNLPGTGTQQLLNESENSSGKRITRTKQKIINASLEREKIDTISSLVNENIAENNKSINSNEILLKKIAPSKSKLAKKTTKKTNQTEKSPKTEIEMAEENIAIIKESSFKSVRTTRATAKGKKLSPEINHSATDELMENSKVKNKSEYKENILNEIEKLQDSQKGIQLRSTRAKRNIENLLSPEVKIEKSENMAKDVSEKKNKEKISPVKMENEQILTSKVTPVKSKNNEKIEVSKSVEVDETQTNRKGIRKKRTIKEFLPVEASNTEEIVEKKKSKGKMDSKSSLELDSDIKRTIIKTEKDPVMTENNLDKMNDSIKTHPTRVTRGKRKNIEINVQAEVEEIPTKRVTRSSKK